MTARRAVEVGNARAEMMRAGSSTALRFGCPAGMGRRTQVGPEEGLEALRWLSPSTQLTFWAVTSFTHRHPHGLTWARRRTIAARRGGADHVAPRTITRHLDGIEGRLQNSG